LEDATVHADASDRELQSSGSHGEPHPGLGQMPGGSAHSIIEDIRLLGAKAQAVLFDALLPGEQPHVVIPGAGGAAIAGTGERILVIKSGVRGGALLGARAKAFEYESVIGVRLDTNTSPAVIAVDAPVKIATCRVYWADSRDNPWKARNAIPVEQPYQTAEAGVSALRGLLEAYRDRHPGLAANAPDRGARVMEARPRTRRSTRAPAPAPDEDAEEEHAVVSALPGLPGLGERCPHCRAELRSGWRYCPGCGAPSESATARP
jgi:hypothetical protein